MNARFARIFVVCSLILNIVLVGTVLSLNQRPVEQAVAPEPIPAVVGANPFRWNQLESSDYPTYIANLRAIVCPEQTVREIVAADLDDSYALRRQPLLKKIAEAPSPEIAQAQKALAQLRSEEAVVFRKLFGIPEPLEAPAVAVMPATRPRARRPVVEETNAVMPLVFQPVDTNQAKLTGEQLKSIDEVRQTFLAVLGTNQDVNSPEYFQRWQAAQKEADNLLGGLIGRQAQLNYEAAVESRSSMQHAVPARN